MNWLLNLLQTVLSALSNIYFRAALRSISRNNSMMTRAAYYLVLLAVSPVRLAVAIVLNPEKRMLLVKDAVRLIKEAYYQSGIRSQFESPILAHIKTMVFQFRWGGPVHLWSTDIVDDGGATYYAYLLSKHEIEDERCCHDYDCCGNWYYRAYRQRFHIGSWYVWKLYHYQNV